MESVRNSFHLMSGGLNIIFRRPSYIFVAMCATMLMFLVMGIVISFDVIFFIITSRLFSIYQQFFMIAKIILTGWSYLTPFELILSTLIFIESGITAASLVFISRHHVKSSGSFQKGLFGLTTATLVFGCLSCGSFILSLFFGLSFSVAVISFLPLRGLEFGFVSILILTFLIFRIAKGIGANNLFNQIEKNK